MLQAANTDIFNSLAPKAHDSECQIKISYPNKPLSQLKLVCGFLFFEPSRIGTNGLNENSPSSSVGGLVVLPSDSMPTMQTFLGVGITPIAAGTG